MTGSPMAEVLHQNLAKIEASDIHAHLGLEKGKYILLSAHREENIDTEKNFTSLFTAINKMAEKYDMPILYSCHPRSRKRLEQSGFVERLSDPVDRRSRIVSATEQAQSLSHEIELQIDENERQMVRGLTEQETVELKRMLQVIAKNLE